MAMIKELSEDPRFVRKHLAVRQGREGEEEGEEEVESNSRTADALVAAATAVGQSQSRSNRKLATALNNLMMQVQ